MLKNKINNIKLFGFHGVYKDEIENGQDFIINIEYIPDYKIESDLVTHLNKNQSH